MSNSLNMVSPLGIELRDFDATPAGLTTPKTTEVN